MKILLFILLFFGITSCLSQIHNRVLKFNVGISGEQISLANDIETFNDTSAIYKFNHKYTLPTFSFSEEFTMNELFSLTGTLGYQYYNIDFNNQKYGTNLFFASVNPQLSIFYRSGFEYYVKLKVGIIYRQGQLESIPTYTQRFFPVKLNLFTGVTFAGVNVFFHENWGANLELALWSPELVSLGLTYRFFKGDMPENVLNDYYTDSW